MKTMTARVQIINSTYEPISTTKVSRAITLVVRGDAVIEEADPERFVRSVDAEYPWPLVVRLLRYVKVPVIYREQHWSKRGVLERDKYVCGYCAKRATTTDHILPVSRGGENSWLNTVASCGPCNWGKDARTPQEAGMELLITPSVPMKMYFNTKKSKKT